MFRDNLEKIWEIVQSGGPIMVALLLLAGMLYWNSVGLLRFIFSFNVQKSLESQVGSNPNSRGEIIEFRQKLKNLIETQLKYAKVLIVAAPLLGLLGTVIGMLDTFRGLGSEDGGDTAVAVADGIKIALITTQTGLMIAILGLLFGQVITWLYKRKDLQLLDIELEIIRKGFES